MFRYQDAESTWSTTADGDNRIHCLLYFLPPNNRGLKEIDIKFMKELDTKVNIIPVIAKADGLAVSDAKKLKARILDEIQARDIQIYQIPEAAAELRDYVPFTVCGADTRVEVGGKTLRGRQYSWGMVEVDNPDHCDFSRLMSLLVTQMPDLITKIPKRIISKKIFSLMKNFNNNFHNV